VYSADDITNVTSVLTVVDVVVLKGVSLDALRVWLIQVVGGNNLLQEFHVLVGGPRGRVRVCQSVSSMPQGAMLAAVILRQHWIRSSGGALRGGIVGVTWAAVRVVWKGVAAVVLVDKALNFVSCQLHLQTTL
jgi:hypothetical protein